MFGLMVFGCQSNNRPCCLDGKVRTLPYLVPVGGVGVNLTGVRGVLLSHVRESGHGAPLVVVV
jgi:hypothetical protein